MALPRLTGILRPGDIDDDIEDFKVWIKKTVAELPRQETEEISALKKEISDLTYTIKQLTERVDNLERKV